MQIKITPTHVISAITALLVALYAVNFDHSMRKGQEQERQLFQKLENSLEQTRANKQSYGAIQAQLADVKTTFSTLVESIKQLNYKVVDMTQDYLKKSEFQASLNKLETNTRSSILRQGEVMYNDRSQLQIAIKNTLTVAENNAKEIEFIKGRQSQLLTDYPRRIVQTQSKPYEKISLQP